MRPKPTYGTPRSAGSNLLNINFIFSYNKLLTVAAKECAVFSSIYLYTNALFLHNINGVFWGSFKQWDENVVTYVLHPRGELCGCQILFLWPLPPLLSRYFRQMHLGCILGFIQVRTAFKEFKRKVCITNCWCSHLRAEWREFGNVRLEKNKSTINCSLLLVEWVDLLSSEDTVVACGNTASVWELVLYSVNRERERESRTKGMVFTPCTGTVGKYLFNFTASSPPMSDIIWNMSARSVFLLSKSVDSLLYFMYVVLTCVCFVWRMCEWCVNMYMCVSYFIAPCRNLSPELIDF